MTFNIRNGMAEDGPNHWAKRKELTAETIRNANCDLIGLQEVFDFQLEYLLSELPEYDHYSVGREDGEHAGEQCSILWRRGLFTLKAKGTFWLSNQPTVPNSMTWGNRITRICSWVEFEDGLTFMNTHWDHESVPSRVASANLVLRGLPASKWILVGDFNSEPDWKEMIPLARAEGAQFVTAGNRVATFHDFVGGTIGDHIDHIFASKDLVASDVQVLVSPRGSVYPSDHYPVICRFES